MINIAGAVAGLLFMPAPWSDVNLTTDNRFDPFVAGLLVEIDCTVKDAMIGQCQCGKFQLMRLFHELIQTARPIEQRVLGVQMQMNKLSMRHGANLLSLATPAQAGVIRNVLTERRCD